MSADVVILRPVECGAGELQQRLQASTEAEVLIEHVAECAEAYSPQVCRDMLNRIAAGLMARAASVREEEP